MSTINVKNKKTFKLLLTGNEAIAVGAYKAGIGVATGYPGTPSSEILPYLSRYKGPDVNWSVNEKTALEIAIGASIGNKRAMFTTKHVGLNVASDPLMTLALTGVNGGIVIVTADDPSMHSSQNEQDNRLYAKFAKVPLLEPSDSEECLYFTEKAFEISEKFDTPVILRTTTRISHSRSIVNIDPVFMKILEGGGENYSQNSVNKEYAKDIEKFVMVPVYARKRHETAVKRLEALADFSDNSGFNLPEYLDPDYGVITGGISYQYVKEAVPEASVLKLAFSNPLPVKLIKEFTSKIKKVVVVEELEPFIQEGIAAEGIRVEGRKFFSRTGELTPDIVRKGLEKAGFYGENNTSGFQACEAESTTGIIPDNLLKKLHELSENLPPRLPALCSGCPHTSVFYALKKLRVPVMGDIGCYTLGALPPLASMDSCISMGLAFGAAQGLYLSGSSTKKTVGIMGDSTFFHSGLASLIDARYNNAVFTAIILDNSTTAMTGGQDHPGTGYNLSDYHINPDGKTMANRIDIKKVLEGIGIGKSDIYEIDPYDYKKTLKTIKQALASKRLNVVITNRPCALYPKKIDLGVKFKVLDGCNGCGLCVESGCPSILLSGKLTDKNKPVPFIDSSCIGCGICRDICIFNFIST